MKSICWYSSILGCFIAHSILSNAQATCGMYTYNDLYPSDSDGIVIGDNYTQAQCAHGNAYAEIHVVMPSGTSWSASASGASSAEALAQASISWETGDGVFEGYNEVTIECWDFESFAGFHDWIRIGQSVEWYGNYGPIAPSVYEFRPLDPQCFPHAICGNNGFFTDNYSGGYIREANPWISIGGSPAPYGPGVAFCVPASGIQRTNNPPGEQGVRCYDVGQ